MVSLGSASISGSDRSSYNGQFEGEQDGYYSPSIADNEGDRSDDWNGPLALDSVSIPLTYERARLEAVLTLCARAAAMAHRTVSG